jgi:LacI family repressor for deo operon, udp, cdd, tsx, nupC, and nupG
MVRRVTIHDVAREAGVAASTVSRTFSAPDRISAQTRERVVTIAHRMGYRPNPVARALPRGKTLTLALLVPDITNPFFFGLIRGAERQAATAGYTLVLADTGESAAMERTHIERLTGGADGFVLASSRLGDDALRAAIAGAPAVVVNRQISGLPSVVINEEQGMRQAVDHLVSLGHRSIAYLGGPANSWSNRAKWRALQAATRQHGIAIERLGPFSPTVAGGAAAADAALIAGTTAVIAFNDLLAIGTQMRLHARGIDVPADVSVVGCDDIFGADFCRPPLTTLAADIEQAGRSAIDLLLGTLRDTSPEKFVLASHLRIRESTGPAKEQR